MDIHTDLGLCLDVDLNLNLDSGKHSGNFFIITRSVQSVVLLGPFAVHHSRPTVTDPGRLRLGCDHYGSMAAPCFVLLARSQCNVNVLS